MTRISRRVLPALMIACLGAGCLPADGAGSRSPATATAPAASQASAPSSAVAGGQCAAQEDPLVVVVVSGPDAVAAALTKQGSARLVARDPETLIFADGRVVTSRLDAVGEHLTRLGWTHREIVISSMLRNSGGGSRVRRG